MRILIHGINYSPELTGIGKYTGEMAEWLAAQGHEVRVVTAPPYYPQWKVAEGFVNGWRTEFQNCRSGLSLTELCRAQARPTQAGVTVYRCPLWVPAKPSGLKRVLHLASFALSSFPIMLRQIFWRPDVVWVVEPPLFCAPQAWLVARLSGAKAWLHIQDYEVDAAFDLGLLKGKLLRGLVASGERWLMRRFDRVSTISLRMVDRAVSKGVPLHRVVMLRNWVEISQVPVTVGKGQGYRAELGIADDAVVALYSGNMGGKQGLEILAEAARICSRAEARPTSVEFVFCGNGAGRDDLVARCAGLPNVRFLDLQPAERLGELLATADIHLLPQRADAADLVMPSKLTGMLASGRPVVATAHVGTELATVVQDCGLVVPPEQAHAFAEAISKLANEAALRSRLGVVGRAYAVANLDRDAVLAGFEQALKALISKAT
jgi:colanic acid biosynthesis glycosyl transferase WcaI